MPRTETSVDLLMLLDRLEELREDMTDLGVSTLDDIERLMREIEAQLDDVPGDGRDGPV